MDKDKIIKSLLNAGQEIEKGLRQGAQIVGKAVKPIINGVEEKIKQRQEEAMAMKRCESGHYYDASKSADCPLCKHEKDSAGPKSVPQTGHKDDIKSMPQRIGEPTVAVMVKEHGVDAVVGWLVCISGPDKGRDFRIRSERNFIGRSAHMDVALTQDETVSRENHATVIFNPKKKNFKIVPGGGRGLIYLNGEEVLEPTDIKRGDKIDIGKSELIFVPFVGDVYDWGDTSEHPAAPKNPPMRK